MPKVSYFFTTNIKELLLFRVEINKKSFNLNTFFLIKKLKLKRYNCLAAVLMATQTKENLFIQFLFATRRDKGEKLFEILFEGENSEFSFEIYTNFAQKSQKGIINHQKKLENKILPDVKNFIFQKFFEESLYTQNEDSKYFLPKQIFSVNYFFKIFKINQK